MAQIEKFTDSGVELLLKHSERLIKNDRNKQIVKSRSDLNYTVDLNTGDLDPREAYELIKSNCYIYGRGTKREENAVTTVGIVVTLPKGISDYSAVDKKSTEILNPEEEKSFFEGVGKFISERYGTCYHNRIHYDEGGQPHGHFYIVPVTEINMDKVKNKTIRTHKAVKVEGGRYEYEIQFKLENGKKIPLKNFDKMTQYYEYKISAKDVINRAELQYFHKDLAAFLKKNGYPGGDQVYTDKTGGLNLSVKALKEFTLKTGLTLDQIKAHPLSYKAMEQALEKTNLKPSEKRVIESINKDAIIAYQHNQLVAKNNEIEQLKKEIAIKADDKTISVDIKTLKNENKILSEKVSAPEKEKQILANNLPSDKSAWGINAGWGTRTDIEEEKKW